MGDAIYVDGNRLPCRLTRFFADQSMVTSAESPIFGISRGSIGVNGAADSRRPRHGARPRFCHSCRETSFRHERFPRDGTHLPDGYRRMFLGQRSGPAKIGFGILDGIGDGFFS
jgi:hypothetical protein